MGLIDADKIINRLDAVTKDGGENVKVFSINDIKYLLNNEPTTYDVDKVVAQLERDKFIESETTLSDVHQGYNAGLSRAIEIVKGGGVNG